MKLAVLVLLALLTAATARAQCACPNLTGSTAPNEGITITAGTSCIPGTKCGAGVDVKGPTVVSNTGFGGMYLDYDGLKLTGPGFAEFIALLIGERPPGSDTISHWTMDGSGINSIIGAEFGPTINTTKNTGQIAWFQGFRSDPTLEIPTGLILTPANFGGDAGFFDNPEYKGSGGAIWMRHHAVYSSLVTTGTGVVGERYGLYFAPAMGSGPPPTQSEAVHCDHEDNGQGRMGCVVSKVYANAADTNRNLQISGDAPSFHAGPLRLGDVRRAKEALEVAGNALTTCVNLAQLGTPAVGVFRCCADCAPGSDPCQAVGAAGGGGTTALRVNLTAPRWRCP